MSDLPVESRYKYGKDQFDDIDADDLAGFLSGAKRPNAVPDLQTDREVDEDVFSAARDSDSKYGR